MKTLCPCCETQFSESPIDTPMGLLCVDCAAILFAVRSLKGDFFKFSDVEGVETTADRCILMDLAKSAATEIDKLNTKGMFATTADRDQWLKRLERMMFEFSYAIILECLGAGGIGRGYDALRAQILKHFGITELPEGVQLAKTDG